ncbi:PilC/PilY family type IV pilus protein [Desulfogranum japonicum]|uniref:PilC/PilY family type IV pilus protein n=1 Tax=Desulfogranum japonicum TaxID=231447 RepID=UPI00040BEBE0|nr:PilC/PilY family type IV pilus protein [Desulfogranum japonicum]
MKRFTFSKSVLVGTICSAVLSVPISFAATSIDYQVVPPFVASGAPPLVMLVMGRNHKLYYEAYNDASDLNDDGKLDVTYDPTSIDYYGYFDNFKCYTYDSSASSPLFEPSSTTTDKKCSGSNEWSGDFLNYLTMSRMDTIRKVLYGGYRSTDAAGDTVLQRVFVPHDAHTWGKEYTSVAVNGYDISDYSPLTAPVAGSGLRHLFASTTKTDGGPPLLRVLPNNPNRIWDWVSSEAPVAKDNLEVSGGSHPGHPTDHADFELMVTTYAIAANQYGSGSWLDYSIRNHVNERYPSPSTSDFGAIDGVGNPYGTNYNPYSSGSAQQEKYLAVFTGTLNITTGGTYSFAVDGDDAIEVIIDGGTPDELIVGYYGGHGVSGGTSHNGSTVLSAGTHTVEFRMEEASGGDQYFLYWNGPDSSNSWQIIPAGAFSDLMLSTYTLASAGSYITDYETRVRVCDASVGLESNCKQYPDGNYKPTGLLQRHGETGRMYFGLMTGSWTNNTRGGVLRKEVGDISNEIDLTTGVFTSVNGIINTFNSMHIQGYSYSTSNYNQNCGWITSGPMTNGKCRDWGNPIAEMMYETERYFAGKGSPTSTYTYDGTDTTLDDYKLGLPLASWDNPYDPSTGYDSCSQPYMLVLSDINPTFDGDDLPGVNSNFGSGISTDMKLDDLVTDLNVEDWANMISTGESESGNRYIGQNGADFDYVCSVKNVSGFGDIRGLCPEEPTKGGSYYSAAVAYYGHVTDLQPTVNDDQSVRTYAVGLASPLPRIELDVGGTDVTLVPFAKTIGNRGTSTVWKYWPTNTIVDFFVEEFTETYGVFRINYEDVEQGADHDMDDIVKYTFQLVDASGNAVTNTASAVAVDITLEAGSASGGYIQHAGYIISGTTKDGTYLEVRDSDTGSSQDFLTWIDTPPGVDPIDPTDTAAINGRDNPGDTHDSSLGVLPLSTTRRFYPDSSGGASAASLIPNPLWYAAKWGSFEDSDSDGTPNLTSEWDEDNDGVPDTYYYVTNPLRLQEQLNKSFADILNRASSGTTSSVISNSRSGEGALYQSVFYPKKSDTSGAANTVTWIGQLHALFVDSYGNTREDSNDNDKLDVEGPDLDGKHGVLQEDINFNCVLDTEDINGNGTLDSGEDINGNGILDTEDANGNNVFEYETCATVYDPLYHPFLSQIDAILVSESGGVTRYYDINGNGKLDDAEILWNVGVGVDIDNFHFLWNSTDWLNSSLLDPLTQRTSYISNNRERYIFTWVDGDSDNLVDTGEVKDFTWPATAPAVSDLSDPSGLYAYLHLYSSFGDMPTAISSLSTSDFETFLLKQTEREINWVRGQDDVDSTGEPKVLNIGGKDVEGTEMRSRYYNGSTWRLGDIVYSSPVLVSSTGEYYNQVYYDSSYAAFAKKYDDRRHVIYAGANDGMLHAFNGGFYDDLNQQYCREINSGYNPWDSDLTNDTACNSATTYPELGAELWAYVPFNLLSHLHWLTDPDYGHSYYMDLQPTVFDAKVFADDTDHPNGWGTILVAGMRLGGATVQADLDKTDGSLPVSTDPVMSSAYVIFDITNPEIPPTLLGEIRMPKMGFSLGMPTVVKLKDGDHDGVYGTYDDTSPENGENRWFLAFGSGPANASGEPDPSLLTSVTSNQNGQFYMIDLVKLATNNELYSLTTQTVSGTPKTGVLTAGLHPYLTLEAKTFVTDPGAVDWNSDYNTDVVYFGTVTDTNGGTPAWTGKMRRIVIDDVNDGDDDRDPSNWVADNVLIDVEQPLTAGFITGYDSAGRRWLYFGTGRYYDAGDVTNLDTQSFYGIKESLSLSGNLDWSTVNKSTALMNTTNYTVYTDQRVDADGTLTDWSSMMTDQEKNYSGWYLDFLSSTGTQEGERTLSFPSLTGGLAIFTSFIPSADICIPSGNSYLWTLYYMTGTAYYDDVWRGSSGLATSKIGLGQGLATISTHSGTETSNDGTVSILVNSSGGTNGASGVGINKKAKVPHPRTSGIQSWKKR